ncbi:hypothetical protein Mapa_000807 [Marchantia paleacea]|nr:hypothetical protein Mapa_000807 [Marchantia paleacea]
MEAEVEGRVKPLPYKVRSVSRESAAQKAAHVLDPDLRTHWSTSTNTKEWLVLELEESCLLSHIRIHNKSVLEWEISIGLRFKPDTYLKVRPRCEAPRRAETYHIGFQPCCFVRIACLRGNPIAIFHIQLMGIPVPGLEPELQPVVDQVLPHIIAHIRDPHDIYLQLLQDISSRLAAFLPHLEGELAVSNEAMETSIRFFAMLVSPFYPILTVLGGSDKSGSSGMEADTAKSNQATVFTVSSNFQAPPKRVRSPGLSQQPAGHALALRPDAVLLLLRVACKDNCLGNVSRKVARILRRLNGSSSSGDNSLSVGESAVPSGGSTVTGFDDVSGNSEATAMPSFLSDYSSIFGEEFRPYDDDGLEINHLGILDVAAVEEGFLHVLYACASQPVMCRRLADSKSDLIPVLPFIQAMLPALRPLPSIAADADQVDETFWQWQAPTVQRAVTQVVALSSSPSYRPLIDACAGYLSSYSPAHEKAACVLIDLCAGPLAPWLPMVVAKVDLAIELLEDLLGIIQAGQQDTSYARAALVYLMLALSGNVDDVLSQYKDVKHHILFLVEMLEPFLIPAISPMKSTIAFGDVSAVLLEKQEQTCALALDLLHTAIKKPAVLPAMEAEWRRGHVTPSVLLSILAPHIPLPPGIDLRRSSGERSSVHASEPVQESNGTVGTETVAKFGTTDDEGTSKGEFSADGISKSDLTEDPSLLFAPVELRSVTLPSVASRFEGSSPDSQKVMNFSTKVDGKLVDLKGSTVESKLVLDPVNAEEYFNLQAEYLQLVKSQERELRAMEFVRFATELHSRRDASKESHQAAIDALLLAAECHLNPFFMVPSTVYQQQVVRFRKLNDLVHLTDSNHTDRKKPEKDRTGLEVVLWLEEERDKAVLRILMEAAEWDSSVENLFTEGSSDSDYNSETSCGVHIFKEDAQAEDAITLVREHQGLLCAFLIHQLRRERHNMYEVLLQGLLIILDSATRLFSPPEEVIEVILQCAERLNNSLILYYSQVRDGIVLPEAAVAYGIRRQWALLRRLVLVASGGRSSEDDDDIAAPRGCVLQTALIPAWAWMSKIPDFSSSAFPLVRYVGWMALSRYAKFYKETGLPLVSDMQQLTSLLLVYSDELSSVSGWKLRKIKEEDVMIEAAYRVATSDGQNLDRGSNGDPSNQTDPGGLVKALYPELDLVFPQLRNQFSQFANAMLESVCQLLKAVPSSTIPDLLSWFSEVCSEPFPPSVKGYGLANVKYVIVYLLEVIVVEHMEAIVPELPRMLEVLLSLCSSSYSDVPLLESVLAVLKPIISHATSTVATVEDYSPSLGPGATFESLCFDAMTERLKAVTDGKESDSRSTSALLLFLAGSLLSDLSVGRRIELINSFTGWVNFTATNSTTVYYNYLRAFQKILEECCLLLQNLVGEANFFFSDEKPPARKSATQALFALTAPSFSTPTSTQLGTPVCLESVADIEDVEAENGTPEDEGDVSLLDNQDEPAVLGEVENETTPEDGQGSVDDGITSQDLDMKSNFYGSSAEIEEFKQKCTDLALALGPALEVCWRIHPILCRKVAQLAAKCLYFSSFEETHGQSCRDGVTAEKDDFQLNTTSGAVSDPLEVLAQKVKRFQEAHCWQVATVTMDFLLSLPTASSAAGALKGICAALQYQCTHAPRVAWRLQTSKWLVKALPLAGKESLSSASIPLIELLCVMLEHSEPEQRLGALQQLGKLIKSDLDYISSRDMIADDLLSRQSQENVTQKSFAHVLVASTWEKVTSTAACDPSLGLRKEALELLLKFVTLAEPTQLQSFLRSSDAVLPALTSSAASISSGPLTRLGLMVLSRSCLYSSPSYISTIPARVWNSIELMANAKAGGVFAEAERSICQALLQLREHGEAEKQALGDILSGKVEKQSSPSNFAPVREAVLEVLARLSAVWSKEDSIAAASEELAKEVKEAEIELELLSQEKSPHKTDGSENLRERVSLGTSGSISGFSQGDPKERLKQLKTQIMAEEHAKTYAAIAARREKQRIARRDRQLALEKAAIREIELLQELDRLRAAEAERDIERQRTLEKERAKTREMRHNLELEAERRSQFQREMEQRESGAMRSSRREFASATTPSSRPRERYRERERESGRTGQDGGTTPRPSAAGGGAMRESGTTPPATPTAAAGTPTAGGGNSRSSYNSGGFAQGGRDRDDRGGYEESTAEGNGARGEMGGDGNSNFGDVEGGGSGLEAGSAGNLASGHRQSGSRTTRPTRQIVERRERDGRREGKWERKQT